MVAKAKTERQLIKTIFIVSFHHRFGIIFDCSTHWIVFRWRRGEGNWEALIRVRMRTQIWIYDTTSIIVHFFPNEIYNYSRLKLWQFFFFNVVYRYIHSIACQCCAQTWFNSKTQVLPPAVYIATHYRTTFKLISGHS